MWEITRVVCADCADGIVSALIVSQAIPGIQVEFLQYGPDRLRYSVARGMCFVGIAPPESQVEAALSLGIHVFDHHIGQENITRRFENSGLGVYAGQYGTSGALLAYRHIYSRRRPHEPVLARIAHLVSMRETHKEDDLLWKDACAVSAGVIFLGYEALQEFYVRDIDNFIFTISTIGTCFLSSQPVSTAMSRFRGN